MNKYITKILSVLCILSIMLGCAACKNSSVGSNETDVDDETQILEVPTADVDIQSMTKEAADFKQIDNYWCHEIVVENETWYQTAPIWTGERYDIYDIKDMFIDTTSEAVFNNISNINKPAGAKVGRGGICADYGLQIYQWTKPDYALAKEDNPDTLKDEYFAYAYGISCIRYDNNSMAETELRKSDVSCLNIALYEDWCDYRQKLTFKIYGVTDEQFDAYQEISEDGGIVCSYFKPIDFYDDYKSGKVTLDKLVEEEVTETGKYYVDYADIQKGKEYKQILYVIETDCDSSKYAFSITGMEYDINESATDEYSRWKENNKELFWGEE